MRFDIHFQCSKVLEIITLSDIRYSKEVVHAYENLKHQLFDQFYIFAKFSVSFRNIETIPFPAVTVCSPNSRKWPAMIKALNYFDQNDMIFDAINMTWKLPGFIRSSFEGFSYKRNLILNQLNFEVQLNHELPGKLNLLPIEMEVFYLAHFLCYILKSHCILQLIMPSSKIGIKSILCKNSRQETAEELKKGICGNQKIDCTLLNNTLWMECLDVGNSSSHQEWCKDCKNLSDCLYSYYTSPKLLQLMVNMFFLWRKFLTKKDLIHASMLIFLDKDNIFNLHHSTLNSFEDEFGNYFKNIQPISNSNLTLLDTWALITGNFENNRAGFAGYLDDGPIEAMKKCTKMGNDHNCQMATG